MRPAEEIDKLVKKLRYKASAETHNRILGNVMQALEKKEKQKSGATAPSIWRIIMKSSITKLAAAVVLIVGVVIFSLIVSPGVTFADVIKPLFEAKTFAYDLLVGGEGGPVARDHVSGNRIRRTMSTGPNIVLIIDADAAKVLRLDTAGKTAALVDIAGPLEKHARDYIAFVRETIERLMADPNFEPKEQFQRQIDGRKAIGYSLGNDRERITILADAETGALVQIELEWGREICILKNFEFNIPISENQISLDPPAGYTMRRTQMDFSKLSEKDLIESLRVWAKYLRDGTFPPQLLKQEYIKQIPLFRQKIGGLSIPDAEKEQLGNYFIQGMMFIQILNEMEWHYAGAGVKLGDAETAIVWYRPEGSETYRVIYGDLSVKDVAEENLPK
ncbi:MAG: hypothetical protein HQ580_06180 [Planctomycetes bacterium]|nr:hypothetical protein [Planctomycetota bacterium]